MFRLRVESTSDPTDILLLTIHRSADVHTKPVRTLPRASSAGSPAVRVQDVRSYSTWPHMSTFPDENGGITDARVSASDRSSHFWRRENPSIPLKRTRK